MTPEQIAATKTAVDYAASQNDRWLFIAALVILIVFMTIVIKWLVAQNESQRASHEKQQAAQQAMMEKGFIVLHDATNMMGQIKEWLARNVKSVLLLVSLSCLCGCASFPIRGSLSYVTARGTTISVGSDGKSVTVDAQFDGKMIREPRR